jgi:gamma-glutamyltranspeptidase/glutathione hydrolase
VQGEANAIVPGKRMLSSMSPTIVVDSRGQVELLVGARGGSLIISAVLQIALNVIEYGMPIADAIAVPRWHHQGYPDVLTYEAGGVRPDVITALEGMGYVVKTGGTGRATAIQRGANGTWIGVVDPRREGLALGY